MSTDRSKRLGKLLKLQDKLKALHETRHAHHVAAAVQAEAEASEIAARFDDPDSLSSMFPEVYHRRINAAVTRRDRSRDAAEQEATRVNAANVRRGIVEDAYREAIRTAERTSGDRERLEIVERRLKPR